MKVLVIGASGQVGSALFKKHLSLGDHVQGTYLLNSGNDLVKLDASDRPAVLGAVQCFQPDLIYLPGAQTNVDRCETDRDWTRFTNVAAVKNVVDALAGSTSRLVFYSTDYVFDGLEGLYSETDPVNPINEYGRQKVAAEHYIVQNCNNYLIFRTSGVFGPDAQQKNFVVRLLDNLRKGKNDNQVAIDEYGTPTYSPELADTSVTMAGNLELRNGIYHVGGTLVSRFKFALAVARIFNCDEKLIRPCYSAQLNRPARRPLNAGLSCAKINKLGFTFSSAEGGLLKLKKEMEK